jgi:hypothetical protein
MDYPVNRFLNLIKVQSATANGIFQSLLDCLLLCGMRENILSSYLMSAACDDAAVMLGRKSGVAKLLKDDFPSVIVWHCTNHRL